MSEAWQSVKKPPREYEVVLIGRDKGRRCSMPGYWTGEHWLAFVISGTMEFLNPTHWQPLPAPPAAPAGHPQ